jgi:hypothetical protein
MIALPVTSIGQEYDATKDDPLTVLIARQLPDKRSNRKAFAYAAVSYIAAANLTFASVAGISAVACTSNAPSVALYQSLKLVPVMLTTSAFLVRLVVVVGM